MTRAHAAPDSERFGRSSFQEVLAVTWPRRTEMVVHRVPTNSCRPTWVRCSLVGGLRIHPLQSLGPLDRGLRHHVPSVNVQSNGALVLTT